MEKSLDSGYPDSVRDGLHPFQYYNLAKLYLSTFDLTLARACLVKLRDCASDEAAELAHRLEDCVLPKYPVSEELLQLFRQVATSSDTTDYEAVRGLVKQFPNFEWPYFELLNDYKRWNSISTEERLEEQKFLMRKVLEINSHNVSALLQLATIERWKENYDEADQYSLLAKELYPEVIRNVHYQEPKSYVDRHQAQAEVDKSNEDHRREHLERLDRELKEAQERDEVALNKVTEPDSIQSPVSSEERKPKWKLDKLHLFLDKAGKISLRCGPNCKAADRFSDGILVVETGESHSKSVQVWDKNGDKVFDVSNGEAHRYSSEGLLGVRKNWDSTGRRYRGFVSPSGQEVIGGQFFEAEPFKNGMSRFQTDCTIDGAAPWGFCDRSGAVQIEPIYDDAYNFSDGLAAVSLNGKIGFVDTNGFFAIPPKYDLARPFSEGIAHVVVFNDSERSWDEQYIDLKGNVLFNDVVVIPGDESLRDYDRSDNRLSGHRERYKSGFYYPHGDSAYDFHDGLVRSKSGDKYGYRDINGDFVIEPQFDFAHAFNEGLAPVVLGSKLGFIDTTGSLIIPAEFAEVSDFSEGLAAVSHDGYYWGYVDRTGKVVIPEKYLEAFDFAEGIAKVAVEF